MALGGWLADHSKLPSVWQRTIFSGVTRGEGRGRTAPGTPFRGSDVAGFVARRGKLS